jgi:hypothetical protein
MAGKAGLKAGLIGTAAMLVWTVIGRFLPVSGAWVWVSSGVSLLMYAGIGVLAGFFLALPRTPGKGAGAGAIAGLISGVIAGVVGVVILNIQVASGGAVPGLSPEQMQGIQQLTESGMDPAMFALLTIPSVVCVMGIGSGLAAIGGAIFAALKPD